VKLKFIKTCLRVKTNPAGKVKKNNAQKPGAMPEVSGTSYQRTALFPKSEGPGNFPQAKITPFRRSRLLPESPGLFPVSSVRVEGRERHKGKKNHIRENQPDFF
jgi:hypothetical protein